MSDAASAPTRGDLSELDDYDRMLDRLETLIDEGTEKIESGRIRDESKERARQGWYRAVANLIGEWRKLKETRDLAELTEEVERLKEMNDLS